MQSKGLRAEGTGGRDRESSGPGRPGGGAGWGWMGVPPAKQPTLWKARLSLEERLRASGPGQHTGAGLGSAVHQAWEAGEGSLRS